MKKLNIKEIEKKLNKTVARNVISVGFDVAERFTGICILRADKENIYIEDLQLIETSSKADHFHRADHYVVALRKFKQGLEKYKGFKIQVIEQCYYGRNPETLIHLAHFGILTYTELKQMFDTFYYLGATTARATIKFNQKRQEEFGTLKADVYKRDTKDRKGKIKHRKGEKKKIKCKALVHDYLFTEFGLKFDSPDCADAFALALAGLLQ